jgi:hypothetical protein
MNLERSGYVLHDTPDPDVFIVEVELPSVASDDQSS